MKTSSVGRTLIKHFEGFSPSAYKDQGGVVTIAFGHTRGVKMGDTCGLTQADEWLIEDLAEAEDAINGLLPATGLTQNQFDALASFVFNIGQGNFSRSTVLKDLKSSQYSAAAVAILMWNRVNGNVNVGLTRRREAEKALFLTPPSVPDLVPDPESKVAV